MPSVEILSVVHLTNLARRYPANALPPEYHQSQPIPVPGPKGLRVAFLYGKAMIVEPGEGLQLTPPSYLAFLNAVTGDFEELRAVTPGEWGPKHKEEERIGRYLTLPERLVPEFLTKQLRLYQAYDALLPAFATDQANVPPHLKQAANEAPPTKKAAAEFQALFRAVAESPLLPYYQAIGKAFFAWLTRVAPEAN